MKQIIKISSLALIIVFIVYSASAQSGLKIRIATNTGSVMSETGSGDIIVDPATNPGGTEDFSSEMTFGIEAEIIIPLGDKLAVGAEFENARFQGSNEDPIHYNYFVSSYSPGEFGQEPLIYNTGVTNLLGTVRLYPIGHNTFTPFLKLQAGLAMIGTDLRYKDPENQVNLHDPLYSRGTDLSYSEASKYTTAHLGGGIGFEYLLTSNVSVYGDFTLSYINADILDGVPNFTYDETQLTSVYSESATITNQFSIGLCYTFGEIPGGGGGSKKSGKPGKSGSTSKHLPFFRKK